MALSFKFHRCLLSYVLFLLFGLLEKALWFANLVLKAFSVIVLNRFVVFRDDSGLGKPRIFLNSCHSLDSRKKKAGY